MSKTVIVLGGGIGGLSAAHELSERGFSVRVFELRDVPGGKARSVVVPSTAPRQNVGTVHLGSLAASTRRDLPGEHGFRFFPRFYQHIIDTMARTPAGAGQTVADEQPGSLHHDVPQAEDRGHLQSGQPIHAADPDGDGRPEVVQPEREGHD